MDERDESLRLSEKEAIVLRLLMTKAKEMYGLELVAESGGELRRGTVYVKLSDLEDRGS